MEKKKKWKSFFIGFKYSDLVQLLFFEENQKNELTFSAENYFWWREICGKWKIFSMELIFRSAVHLDSWNLITLLVTWNLRFFLSLWQGSEQTYMLIKLPKYLRYSVNLFNLKKDQKQNKKEKNENRLTVDIDQSGKLWVLTTKIYRTNGLW